MGGRLNEEMRGKVMEVRNGNFWNMTIADARNLLQASAVLDGDRFGIEEAYWKDIEVFAEGDNDKIMDLRRELDDKERHLAKRKAELEQAKTEANQSVSEVSVLPLTPIDQIRSVASTQGTSNQAVEEWRKQSDNAAGARMVEMQMEAEKARRLKAGQTPPVTSTASDAPGGASGYDEGHNFGWKARSNSHKTRFIVGGVVAVAVIGTALLAGHALGGNKPAGTSLPARVVASTPSAVSSAQGNVASAMMGGLGENSTKDPALVVCQLRGGVSGMEFHGTLEGANIGSHSFDVKAGDPSQGVMPTSATDGVFALAFPGTGGNHGGGPLGPFTCTLMAVDVPSGYSLALHTSSEWTITVP
jgi:hypothetical protein